MKYIAYIFLGKRILRHCSTRKHEIKS